MEVEKNNHRGKSSSYYIALSVIMVVAALVFIILFLVAQGKETRISEKREDSTIRLLYCKANLPVDPFFVSGMAKEYSHEIKVTFRGERIDKISYNYYGVYDDERLADAGRSELHADYNEYMSDNGLIPEDLYPIFDYDGSTSKVTLYGSRNDNTLNIITARLFFLNYDEYDRLDNISGEDLKNIYIDKGFYCNFDK